MTKAELIPILRGVKDQIECNCGGPIGGPRCDGTCTHAEVSRALANMARVDAGQALDPLIVRARKLFGMPEEIEDDCLAKE